MSGIDYGENDETVQFIRGMNFLCEVPIVLGEVTDIYERNGKIVVETALGHHFIVPIAKINTYE